MAKTIPVGKSNFAVVDDCDFDLLSRFSWRIVVVDECKYATAGRGLLMHRVALGVDDKSILVDHKNGNGLDNQRANLRIASRRQNMMNRRKHRVGSSKYKGVYWSKTYRRWLATLRFSGRCYSKWCDSEAEAAMMYDAFARKHFGEFACVNFPADGERGCLVGSSTEQK